MIRNGSRTAATFKVELFVIIVNGFQLLTNITKCSIVDVAAGLDLSPKYIWIFVVMLFMSIVLRILTAQQTFQRCFYVLFWWMQRRDVGQRQINVETTLGISTLKFTTSNNVESTLCISTLTWTTLDNVDTTLSFSTSKFTTLVNVETTLWKWQL